MIDLHCHSVFSDGVLSPEELIQKAQALKLSCISLTDHDTLEGYPRLYKAAADTEITIIKGIELSVRWRKYDIHILGYDLNDSPELERIIKQQSTSRILRAQKIGEALCSVGVEQAYEKACALAGHNAIGRPHFAKLLVNEGKARDIQAAFRQYLVRGRNAYIPTPWISIQEAVAGINAARGRAVIAHPLKYGLTRTKLHELINDFKEVSGAGIEVVSGDITAVQIKELAGLCLRYELFASSGSDFHSDATSSVNLGRQAALPLHCTPIWHDWII